MWGGLALLSVSVPARAQGDLPGKKVLTLAVARRIADAAGVEATRRHAPVVIAVVDDGAYLLVLHRLDDTQVASVEVGMGKDEEIALVGAAATDRAVTGLP